MDINKGDYYRPILEIGGLRPKNADSKPNAKRSMKSKIRTWGNTASASRANYGPLASSSEDAPHDAPKNESPPNGCHQWASGCNSG